MHKKCFNVGNAAVGAFPFHVTASMFFTCLVKAIYVVLLLGGTKHASSS